MNLIKKIPIPIAGLALGLASLGNLLGSQSIIVKNILGIISAIIIILLITKLIISQKSDIIKELDSPVVLGVSPTFFMAIMVLATYIAPIDKNIAKIIWTTALILQLILVIYFIYKYLIKLNINNVFPSWFIVFSGFVIASVTAPAVEMILVGKILFYCGLIGYFAMLPIILYRTLKVKNIPEPAAPTLAIFIAPINLCLAGYLSSFSESPKNLILLYIMVFFAAVSTLIILIKMPKLIKLKFYPSFSAFTFPFVICAIAFKMFNAFLIKSGAGFNIAPVAKTLEYLAIFFVVFVLFGYIKFLFAKNNK